MVLSNRRVEWKTAEKEEKRDRGDKWDLREVGDEGF
jgi:hypothetical protein